MRDNQRPLIEDGRKRYGTSIANAGNYLAECGHCKANTEHDLKTHRCTICGAKNDDIKNNEGQSKLLHEWVDGKCKTCGITKTENMGDMCNVIEYPTPATVKNVLTNSVAEGRRRYGGR